MKPFFSSPFRWLLLLIVVLAWIKPSQAAHLIGGEITYECQGSNRYTISLRIYRDCQGGGAAFDNNARVAIYDINNNLIRTLFIGRGPIVSLNNLSSDSCITVPPNLCVEYTDYIDTVTLAPILGGYTLVHQRCCRNAIIGNVTNPGSIGNTYSISIPSMDTTCNSSPKIDVPPDNVICLNRPAVIPISVSESDGDSISYELCRIYAGGGSAGAGGGNCFSVIPNPPCPPPFSPVAFTSPYTYQDPIPSSVTFRINPQTGVLTGTASQQGIYVAGICISEWRNGQIMSTVRLDYQFAVSNCQKKVISDMRTPIEDPTILCDGLTVKFENQTVGANSVLWNFGDRNTVADTSRDWDPTYTYPGPGTYLVTLIANPGQSCSDTTFAPFTVKPPVVPTLLWDGVPCFEVQNLSFSTAGNLPSNGRYRWDFGADAEIPFVNGIDAYGIRWQSPGRKPVKLTVAWDSCSVELHDTIDITANSVFVDAGPDTNVPRGQILGLRANFGYDYYWYASSPIEINNPFARDPRIRFRDQDDTVVVYLRLTDQYGCQGTDSLFVYLYDDREQAVYNIITPNGDGLNDFFDLSYLNPSGSCKLTILNRWGSEVYTDDAYGNDWFGTDQDGNTLPDGTYYYVLQCGFEVKSTGPISIVAFP